MRKCTVILTLIGFLFSCSPGLENLGDNYYLEYNGMNDLMIVKPQNYCEAKVILYGHISRYTLDDDFILVVEKSRKRVIGNDTIFSNESHETLLKSKLEQYFIIDKKRDSVFGPFTRDGFIKSRKKLNVSEKLKF